MCREQQKRPSIADSSGLNVGFQLDLWCHNPEAWNGSHEAKAAGAELISRWLHHSLDVSRELQVLPPLRVSKLPETPFCEYPPELFEVQT